MAVPDKNSLLEAEGVPIPNYPGIIAVYVGKGNPAGTGRTMHADATASSAPGEDAGPGCGPGEAGPALLFRTVQGGLAIFNDQSLPRRIASPCSRHV